MLDENDLTEYLTKPERMEVFRLSVGYGEFVENTKRIDELIEIAESRKQDHMS